MDGHVDIARLLRDALVSLRDIRLSLPREHCNKPAVEAALGSLESILEPVPLGHLDEEWTKVVLPSLEMVCRGCILIKQDFQEPQKENSAWRGGKIIGYDISEIGSLLSSFRRLAAVVIYYDLFRSSAVTKQTFKLYKDLVSKSISAIEQMIKHAESVISLKERWAPYISRCNQIYRQILECLSQVQMGVSLELREPIEDISLGGFSVYYTGPKVRQLFDIRKEELFQMITEARNRHDVDTENQLSAQYLEMDEHFAQLTAKARRHEEIVLKLIRSEPNVTLYEVGIWPSNEVKDLIKLVQQRGY